MMDTSDSEIEEFTPHHHYYCTGECHCQHRLVNKEPFNQEDPLFGDDGILDVLTYTVYELPNREKIQVVIHSHCGVTLDESYEHFYCSPTGEVLTYQVDTETFSFQTLPENRRYLKVCYFRDIGEVIDQLQELLASGEAVVPHQYDSDTDDSEYDF